MHIEASMWQACIVYLDHVCAFVGWNTWNQTSIKQAMDHAIQISDDGVFVCCCIVLNAHKLGYWSMKKSTSNLAPKHCVPLTSISFRTFCWSSGEALSSMAVICEEPEGHPLLPTRLRFDGGVSKTTWARCTNLWKYTWWHKPIRTMESNGKQMITMELRLSSIYGNIVVSESAVSKRPSS